MLDIRFIREHEDRVRDAAKKKNKLVDIDTLLELDDERLRLQKQLEEYQAKQNAASKEIALVAQAHGNMEERAHLLQKTSTIKAKIQALEDRLKPIKEKIAAKVYEIPNVVSPDVPVGKNEEDNVVVRSWGEKPDFDFEAKDHMQLAKALDLIDTETAAEVSGSRFAYIKGDLVLLQFALLQMTFNALTDENVLALIIEEKGLDVSAKPFMPIIPPVMVRNSVQKSIHRVFGDQTYQFREDELNLVASAEHTLAPYYMNKTINQQNLPLRFVGYSTAFRKEAGTYGKDMGGIFRTHQFDKIELESFTDAESGSQEQQLMVGIQEYLVQQLGIPYQVVHVCTGDMGGPDYEQFDIECWLPGQGKYRETHTSDYMTDFQTRGIKSYYKGEGGKRLLHTNDATAFAIGRILIAIMENYQKADGTIGIPEALRPYMGGRDLIQ